MKFTFNFTLLSFTLLIYQTQRRKLECSVYSFSFICCLLLTWTDWTVESSELTVTIYIPIDPDLSVRIQNVAIHCSHTWLGLAIHVSRLLSCNFKRNYTANSKAHWATPQSRWQLSSFLLHFTEGTERRAEPSCRQQQTQRGRPVLS